MIVNLEKLREVLAYMREIERWELESIKWMENGKSIKVDPALIEEWSFMGLNNRGFAQQHLLGEPSNIVTLIGTKIEST